MKTNGTSRVVLALVAAVAAMSAGGAAFGQTHGIRIGKSCVSPKCVGEETDCLIEIGHFDGFKDDTAINEVFDVVDPEGTAVRIPPVAGNLPIFSVDGNTTCVVGGSLPCIVCAAGEPCGPGNIVFDALNDGVVVFRSTGYVIQEGDGTFDPVLQLRYIEDQANIITQDRCDGPQTSGCSPIPNDQQFTAATVILECDDGDPCTIDSCDDSACVNTPICDGPEDCSDQNVCTSDVCTPEGCCENPPLCVTNTDCNDNDPCTDDACAPSGCCVFTPVCTLAADCNDSDPCTIDSCGPDGCCDNNDRCPGGICCADGTVCNDNNVCTSDACVNGCCVFTPLCTANNQCNDFNVCTFDQCVGGCCVFTPLCTLDSECNDQNACTDDSCEAGCCVNTPLCTSPADCNDNNVCTLDTCNGGCCFNTPLCTNDNQCNDFNPCTRDVCDAGCCVHIKDCEINANCDQSDLCNPEVCVNDCCVPDPLCALGTVCCADGASCDDGLFCTVDECVEGCCQHRPLDCGDSGDPCTFLQCNEATDTCVSNTIVCDDGDPCTEDICDSATARCIFERSECCGVECPPVTKAKFDIWNENERRFSGTERCISSWDQTLLSRYTEGGARNHFLRTFLQTNRGKARIDGMASTVCGGTSNTTIGGNSSYDAPLLGLAIRELVFNDQQRTTASSELVGMGHQNGLILHDLSDGPPGGSLTDGRGIDRVARSSGKVSSPASPVLPADAQPGVVSGGEPQVPVLIAGRSSASQKGSLLVFTKIEIKWDANGNLIQDTFIELTNDNDLPVSIQGYLVHGDVCTWVDTTFSLTMDQPTYWSALTGEPAGASPFTVLGEGCPDDDPMNPGGRRLRGYFLAWAINGVTGQEIHWNHLSGSATIVNYRDTSAWEYAPWAFQAVYEVPEGSVLAFPYGVLMLDNNEYQSAPDMLLLDFFASGAQFFNGLQSFSIDTDLTLWAVLKDLRQDAGTPFPTTGSGNP